MDRNAVMVKCNRVNIRRRHVLTYLTTVCSAGLASMQVIPSKTSEIPNSGGEVDFG